MQASALPKNLDITAWVMQGIVAIVFLAMGALPKLAGQYMPEQVFEQVGMGSAGMYATGIAELLAGILILIPRTNWIGAGLGAVVMVGAVGSHLFTDLGIRPEFFNPDTGETESGAMLFPMALLLLGLCLAVFSLRKLHPGGAVAPQPAPSAPAESEEDAAE